MTAEAGPPPRSGRISAGLLGVCHVRRRHGGDRGAVGIVGQSQTLDVVASSSASCWFFPPSPWSSLVSAPAARPEGMLVAAVGASGLVLGMITILRLASISSGDGTLKSIICVLFGLAAIVAVLALIERIAPAGRPATKRVSELADALTPSILCRPSDWQPRAWSSSSSRHRR